VTSGDGPRPTDEPAAEATDEPTDEPTGVPAAGTTGRDGQSRRDGQSLPDDPAGPDSPNGQARLAGLLEAHGTYGRPLRALVARLTATAADAAPRRESRPVGRDAGGEAVGQLVRAVGLPRRTVEEVLAALGDDVVSHGVGGGSVTGLRIRPELAASYSELVDAAGLIATAPTDPLAGPLGAHADLVATMRGLIARAPRPRADLDHVAATAETVVRRALWLAATYDLAGHRLLCVGDHDLTSLAVAAAIPGVRVTVVDVDDELLHFLSVEARARGLEVHPYFADLRFGLPPVAAGSADLAFTDPPYTPEGVALFCARGAEGLRDRDHGRVLLAYGFSDRTPTLGWKTQRALSDAGFAIEAMLPAFHAYDGAEAIGARADLYVCRPTTHTWRHVERAGGPLAAGNAIYTRGRASLESVGRELSEAVTRALLAAAEAAVPADQRPPGQLVFVGEPPPASAAGQGWPVTHVRLATVLAQGLPSAVRGRRPVTVAADLTEDPGGWLPRLLLAVNADAMAVVVRADHPAAVAAARAASEPAGRLRSLALGQAAPKWHRLRPTRPGPDADGAQLRVLSFAAIDPARLEAPTDLPVRFLLDRAHGRIGNVWREALITYFRDQHATALSKRDARAIIEAVVPDRAREVLQARLVDLPLGTAADLIDAMDWSWHPDHLVEVDLVVGRTA